MIRTQKSITINGNRFTATELLSLDAYELNGGDMEYEINGKPLVFAIREGYLALKNVGAICRKGFGFGDTVCLLAR